MQSPTKRKPPILKKTTVAQSLVKQDKSQNKIQSNRGCLTYSNGDVFQGQLGPDAIPIFGRLSGRRFNNSEHYEYEGQFQNGLFHGNGKMVYQDGKTLKGRFVEGYLVKGVQSNQNPNYTFQGIFYKGQRVSGCQWKIVSNEVIEFTYIRRQGTHIVKQIQMIQMRVPSVFHFSYTGPEPVFSPKQICLEEAECLANQYIERLSTDLDTLRQIDQNIRPRIYIAPFDSLETGFTVSSQCLGSFSEAYEYLIFATRKMTAVCCKDKGIRIYVRQSCFNTDFLLIQKEISQLVTDFVSMQKLNKCHMGLKESSDAFSTPLATQRYTVAINEQYKLDEVINEDQVLQILVSTFLVWKQISQKLHQNILIQASQILNFYYRMVSTELYNRNTLQKSNISISKPVL